jgi:hypothetical protein
MKATQSLNMLYRRRRATVARPLRYRRGRADEDLQGRWQRLRGEGIAGEPKVPLQDDQAVVAVACFAVSCGDEDERR